MVKALGPDLHPSAPAVDTPEAIDTLATELVGMAQAVDDTHQHSVAAAIAKASSSKGKHAPKKSAKAAAQ